MKKVFHITVKNSSVERITAPYTIGAAERSSEKVEIFLTQSCPLKEEGTGSKEHSHQISLGVNIKHERTIILILCFPQRLHLMH